MASAILWNKAQMFGIIAIVASFLVTEKEVGPMLKGQIWASIHPENALRKLMGQLYGQLEKGQETESRLRNIPSRPLFRGWYPCSISTQCTMGKGDRRHVVLNKVVLVNICCVVSDQTSYNTTSPVRRHCSSQCFPQVCRIA